MSDDSECSDSTQGDSCCHCSSDLTTAGLPCGHRICLDCLAKAVMTRCSGCDEQAKLRLKEHEDEKRRRDREKWRKEELEDSRIVRCLLLIWGTALALIGLAVLLLANLCDIWAFADCDIFAEKAFPCAVIVLVVWVIVGFGICVCNSEIDF